MAAGNAPKESQGEGSRPRIFSAVVVAVCFVQLRMSGCPVEAIGHVRYATTGGAILRNVQPLFAELLGGLAVAHS